MGEEKPLANEATTSTSPNEGKKEPGKNGNVVGLGEKIAVGLGGLTMFHGNCTVKATAMPFFNMILGVNPALIGIMLAIPRFWDGLTDPIMGRISDRYHSKYGRRRPFIFLGAILMALSFGMIWMVPSDWSEGAVMAWFLVTSLLFYTCFTIFAVPFTSLTYEMTPNYNERTEVMGHVTFWGKVAEFSYQWFIPAAALGVTWGLFSDQVAGIRAVLWFAAVFMIGGFGIIPAIFAKERYYKVQEKDLAQKEGAGFWKTVSQAFANKAFVVLIVLTLLQIAASMFSSSMDYYLLVYYMFDGDIAQGSIWKGLLSSAYAVCGFVGIPVIVKLSKKTSKLFTLRTVYALVVLNGVIRWFVYTPGNHRFIFVDAIFGSLYWIAIGTVVQSMIADICDNDELRHGERREGMFGAVFNWVAKTAGSLSYFVGGLALVAVGFNADLGGNQSEDAFLGMRLCMVLGGMIPNMIAFVLLRFYPITKENAAETSRLLEERRGTVA